MQPENIINIHDPGCLLQQSYNTGKSLAGGELLHRLVGQDLEGELNESFVLQLGDDQEIHIHGLAHVGRATDGESSYDDTLRPFRVQLGA